MGLQTFAIWLLFPSSDARSLAVPSWQVVGPKRGADKAKVAREVVEWERTKAALKQWSKEGEIDWCVKAVFDRDWNIGKNQQDTIAQRGAASNRWITSEKQLECRCVENKLPIEHRKKNTLAACYNSLQISGTTEPHEQ